MGASEWKQMVLRDGTRTSVCTIDRSVHVVLGSAEKDGSADRGVEFTLDEAEEFMWDLHGALEKARAAACRPTGTHRYALELRRALASVTPPERGSEAFLDAATSECVGVLERDGVFGVEPHDSGSDSDSQRLAVMVTDLAASQRDVVAALIEISKQNAQLVEMVVTLSAQNRRTG